MSHFRRSLYVSVLLFSICMVATAAEFPEVVFIFDSSGSMAGSAGNQTKMAAAKDVLQAVIPELPPEVTVGLTVYGHRTSNDCTDVEIMIDPGSKERNNLISEVTALQTHGMTPISLAITITADTLASRKAETTMVLISDGRETCGGDPCAVVRALKASGVNFVMYVVGFDVNEQDKQQLSCIAEAGGGQYFGASDQAGLLAALQTVNKEVAEKVEKARSTMVKKKTGLGKLRISVPESALRCLAGIKVVRTKDNKVIKEGALSAADSTHPLMSGDYEIILQFANPNYQPPTEITAIPIEINKGETTDVEMGSIVFNIAEELNNTVISAVLIKDAGTGETYLKTEPHGNDYYLFKPKATPEGVYNIDFQYYRSPEETSIATNIVVVSGKDSTVTLDSGIILQKPESTPVEGWDLLPAGEQDPILSVRRGWDNDEPLWRQFIVPPGIYDLNVMLPDMTEALPAGEGIEIMKGETVTFDTGL